MCLAVPGKIVEWIEREAPFARARVEFGGVVREIAMDCVLEAEAGDYVLAHAGLAISRIDEEEANHVLQTLRDLSAEE